MKELSILLLGFVYFIYRPHRLSARQTPTKQKQNQTKEQKKKTKHRKMNTTTPAPSIGTATLTSELVTSAGEEDNAPDNYLFGDQRLTSFVEFQLATWIDNIYAPLCSGQSAVALLCCTDWTSGVGLPKTLSSYISVTIRHNLW